MSATQTARINWTPKVSAWDQMQAQRARRAAANAHFINVTSLAASSFSDAMTNQAVGTASLAALAAAKRLGIALPSQAISNTRSAVSSNNLTSVNISA
jgi:hypothetical protein